MAVFDANFLVYLLDPGAKPPRDPNTGKPVTRVKERIDHLISQVENAGESVVIPTPALSEYLVKADKAGVRRLQAMRKQSCISIAEFDELAAVELANLTRMAVHGGNKKAGVDKPWQAVKIDRQIVAIAKAIGERVIYSDDLDLHAFAKESGIRACGIAHLSLPP